MQSNSDQNSKNLQMSAHQDSSAPLATSQQAAVNLMREQIDKIYDEPQPNEIAASSLDENAAAGQPQSSKDPYGQTHDVTRDMRAAHQSTEVQADWQKYHSAWQQYYQMYYERYYQAQAQQNLSKTSSVDSKKQPSSGAGAQEFTEAQAVNELRNELIRKVKTQTKKIQKSRHFMPAVSALIVASAFIFLQYNQIIFANVMAYTTPASLDSTGIHIDPTTDVTVDPSPVLAIPKLAVQAPVVYGLRTLDEAVVDAKLQQGVVHYPIKGASAEPGQVGNTVILGHSANDVFAAGDYKFVFLRLEQLQKGDYFYLNYKSKRYTYIITEKKVIHPSQVNELVIDTTKPIATLVTCVPVGTANNRLLVFGEQVAPDPSKASEKSPSNPSDNTEEIGGGTKNFFERLFSN